MCGTKGGAAKGPNCFRAFGLILFTFPPVGLQLRDEEVGLRTG